MAGGRPRKEINKDQFEKLCAMQCTKEEISAFFDCSEDTVERWCKREYKDSFAVVLKNKGASGRISLRRNQFRLAEKNASMAIWLGKQYLGQRDSFEYEDREGIAKLDAILEGMRHAAQSETE